MNLREEISNSITAILNINEWNIFSDKMEMKCIPEKLLFRNTIILWTCAGTKRTKASSSDVTLTSYSKPERYKSNKSQW